MHPSSFITPAGVRARQHASSKKRLLELAATTVTEVNPGLDRRIVFNAFMARERLGSTGLGYGVAIPHCRCGGCMQPLGVLITLDDGIAFDAPDDQPVDILIALVVPEEQNARHLEMLAALAESLESPEFRRQLRAADDDHTLHTAICGAASPLARRPRRGSA